MRYVLLLLSLLLVGCRDLFNPLGADKPIDPEFVEPPEGVSFISAEYDGKRFDYIEGKNSVKSLGISYSSFSSNTAVVGFGETLENSLSGTSWTILFYFTQQEWKQNVENSAKLLNTGTYNFLLEDKSRNLISSRGTVIQTATMIDSTTAQGNTTRIEQDDRPRSFIIKRAYYNNLANNHLLWPLIWIEGSFDGWMLGDKKVKGRFRIKTQANM